MPYDRNIWPVVDEAGNVIGYSPGLTADEINERLRCGNHPIPPIPPSNDIEGTQVIFQGYGKID